jgi:aldehyde:ferredoxin oxidoreductase
MESIVIGGYMHKMLRVDLSKKRIAVEALNEDNLRKYIGGTGLGINYLYEEVPPSVQWNDPGNRIVIASGPLSGTKVGGTGGFSLVTKGCLTNGAASVQANGFLGAFLKFSGFDGIIVQGAADQLVYLYIHNDTAELRDATHLTGKDTWETEALIKKELGKPERECSVFSIGPAGENLVKFACLVGDRGHVAAHNGVGAVMGSKKLKAIVVNRGNKAVEVADNEKLSFLSKDLFKKVTNTPGSGAYSQSRWGTIGNIETCKDRLARGSLPVKNYTTNLFPGYENFSWDKFGTLFETKRRPCWACRFNHCNIMKVKEGRYAGYVGEEPEYEQIAAWGPIIGQTDVVEAFVLSNHVDRLGLDTNESGWLIAWLMECYEKGLLSKDDTGGIEMHWGDADAANAMLSKIAKREGIGDILAEGVKRAAEHVGADAKQIAIYTEKGNTPRAHDHRNVWSKMLDTCTSDTGTDEAGSQVAKKDLGLPADADPFSSEVVAKRVAGSVYRMPLDDCLVMCKFNNRGIGLDYLAELLEAATGWDFAAEEVLAVGYRVVNLLRVYNIRHGHTAELDAPSRRYSSTPVDGPFKGKTVVPVWRDMVQNYYRLMGWDLETGKPLTETLKSLGLEHVTKDIW